MSLEVVREFSDVHTLDLGGGYKVGRMSHEPSTDLQAIGQPVKEAFENFAKESGRQIHLEIEPGTFLLANACALLTTVQDATDTGPDGYNFLKLDGGMTELLRPSSTELNTPSSPSRKIRRLHLLTTSSAGTVVNLATY